MKKSLKKSILALFLCTSVLIPSNIVFAKPAEKPILPLGTGYTDAYRTAESSGSIILRGVPMQNVKIVVKILNGHFYSDITGANTVYLDRADSQWTNNAINCSIISEGARYTSDNTNFSQNVQTQGLGASYSVQQSLTKTEATNIVSQTGIELSIPEFGKITNSTDVSKAYGSSNTKTVTVTMNSNFTMWYSAKTKVNSIGSITTTIQ